MYIRMSFEMHKKLRRRRRRPQGRRPLRRAGRGIGPRRSLPLHYHILRLFQNLYYDNILNITRFAKQLVVTAGRGTGPRRSVFGCPKELGITQKT